MNKNFSLLIKPASYDCNLRCEYCFYLKKEEIYGKRKHRMNNEVLEKMVSSYLALDMPLHSFAWQGGEPTLMGLDFYKIAVSYMKKYGSVGKCVSNALQTNGTLLNDDWAKFFHDYSFLIGVSLDGPAELHNKYRLDCGGCGSHAQVLKGIEVLKRNNTEFNILTMVSTANVDYPAQVYRYLKKQGFKYHQYIECVEYSRDGSLLPFAVTGRQWGGFMCGIFDEWYPRDRHEISVRLFDSILFCLLEGTPNVCAMGSDCRQYLLIENNGDVYPCDFFMDRKWKLGNLMNDSWESLTGSPLYARFGVRKKEYATACQACPWLKFCQGGCPKNRPERGDVPGMQTSLCDGWKIFYEHTADKFKQLAEEIKEKRHVEQLRQFRTPRPVSKNAPCPCGSGLKYKRCCGARPK
ncbi:MAG: anaerobic sulfatase maturase [Victivallales bacterium]|nr:anaerobic sulfatase maturase [Victivallales bacterium]